MFRNIRLILSALILLSLGATYYFEVRLRPDDPTALAKLMQESTDLRTRKALEQTPAHQTRQGVQKDIWTQHHVQIQSEHSDLTLSQNQGEIEAVERLKNIRCVIEADTALTADEGLYTLSSQQFIARTNCLLTHQENWIRGTQIELDFERETVSYEHPTGFLAPFHFQAKKLIWHKREDRIDLTDSVLIEQPDQFTLHADRGTLTLVSSKPEKLFLEGNVQLLSSRVEGKESFAIADTLTYNPHEKTLLFTSPRKVLFWQEGLSLSAPQVLIREDRTVEGKGDVHFTFDLEEQNYIDQLFGKFL